MRVNPKFIIAMCTIITLFGARAGALRAETGGNGCPDWACPDAWGNGACGSDVGPAELCTNVANQGNTCSSNLQFATCSAFAPCGGNGLGAACYWS
jgi:hypothetical protein